MRYILIFLLAIGYGLEAKAAGGVDVPKHEWQFEGLPAEWDKDQLYRGYKVATQVCMACHSFKYVAHRHLENVGFTEAEVRFLAGEAGLKVNDKLISGLDPLDAQEIYGKKVPDLSAMNRARPGLYNYTYALLTGYTDDEAYIKKYFPNGVPEGAYFNKYYPGHAIAMPNPLTGPDLVEYHDGTEATVEQMAKDVTYFMQWTSEPELIERKRLGVYVLIYIFIFTLLAYFLKKSIWRDVH